MRVTRVLSLRGKRVRLIPHRARGVRVERDSGYAAHEMMRQYWGAARERLLSDNTPLSTVLDKYLSRREVGRHYRQHLRRTVQKLAAFGVTSVSGLTPDGVNLWIDSLDCSQQTKANYRRQACTILRAALGPDAAHFIGGIKKIKVSLPPPVAWTQEELTRLLHCARNLKGKLKSGCPAALFFTGWLMAGYSTGLRFSDLLHLRSHQLRGGRLHTVQRKTGDPVVHVLTSECSRVLKTLIKLSPNGTIFRWALAEHWLRVRWRRLCNEAGVSGTPKWMRRTGATWVEATQPGMSSRFLGHRSPELALKHYVDQSLLPNSCPTPPPIAIQTDSTPSIPVS